MLALRTILVKQTPAPTLDLAPVAVLEKIGSYLCAILLASTDQIRRPARQL